MRYEDIVTEFLDYRAYVSHTLCKHRLFLGLTSAKNARLRLRDAAVWPLVCDEAARLCVLASTLFGISDKRIDVIRGKVANITKGLVLEQRRLESGQDSAFERFKMQATLLSNALSTIFRTMDEMTPVYSETVIVEYLAGHGMHDKLAEAHNGARRLLVPHIEGMLGEAAVNSEHYRDYWPSSSEVYHLTRCAIVAAAVNDLPTNGTSTVRELQRTLRRAERVVSCWSPNIAREDRPELVEKSLNAEGFRNIRELCTSLKSGIGV